MSIHIANTQLTLISLFLCLILAQIHSATVVSYKRMVDIQYKTIPPSTILERYIIHVLATILSHRHHHQHQDQCLWFGFIEFMNGQRLIYIHSSSRRFCLTHSSEDSHHSIIVSVGNGLDYHYIIYINGSFICTLLVGNGI